MVEVEAFATVDSALQKIRLFRGMLEAELRGETTKAKYHWIEGRLQALALECGEAGQIELLEARILNNVYYKRRSAQTLNLLQKLRIKRDQAFCAVAYDAFTDRIQTILAPLVVTAHGYQRPFDQQNHDMIWSALAERMTALTEVYPVFLNSGTLLGVVRDGGLIEHDDDIDLAVILNAHNNADAAQEWFEFYQYLLELGLATKEPKEKLGLKMIKLTKIDDIEIDLFPCWVDDGRVHVFPHTSGELAQDDLLPLQPSVIKGFSIPAQPERMLAVNYGEGWRTPDPFFVFDWKRSVRQFAGFRNALDKVIADAAPAQDLRTAAE